MYFIRLHFSNQYLGFTKLFTCWIIRNENNIDQTLDFVNILTILKILTDIWVLRKWIFLILKK